MHNHSIHFKFITPPEFNNHIQNYQENQSQALDHNEFYIDYQNQFKIQNINQDLKKQTTIAQPSTNFTKTAIKGRPKKKQKEVQNQFEEILSEHQKTIFGLILWYTHKSLSKNYKKYSKCGFLHKNIAPSNTFYLQISDALKKNKILTSQYRLCLQKYIKSNQKFQKLLQKLLWVGPALIVDQIIFILVHLVSLSSNIISKYSKLQCAKIEDVTELKEQCQKIATHQSDFLLNKLTYITFKCSRLKFSEQKYQIVRKYFVEFIQVFLFSVILSICQFPQNPYFSVYYSYDYQNQGRNQKKKKRVKKQQVVQKREVIQEQVVKQQQIEYNGNGGLIEQNYQATLEYVQFHNNYQANMLYSYGYFNPYFSM